MKRGTVVWVDLSDTQPPELGQLRPGIIVSGTPHNGRSQGTSYTSTIAVPLEVPTPETRAL